MQFENHVGTHIDGPGHFVADAPPLADRPIETFCFTRPVCIDIPKEGSELITAADLRARANRIGDCDILLLRTGFGRLHDSDPERYVADNPGASADAAQYLQDRFPALRAIALDTISAAAMAHMDEGIKAHEILLGGLRPIMIIEDANLDFDLSDLRALYALPLFFKGLDSSPCAVLGLTGE